MVSNGDRFDELIINARRVFVDDEGIEQLIILGLQQ